MRHTENTEARVPNELALRAFSQALYPIQIRRGATFTHVPRSMALNKNTGAGQTNRAIVSQSRFQIATPTVVFMSAHESDSVVSTRSRFFAMEGTAPMAFLEKSFVCRELD